MSNTISPVVSQPLVNSAPAAKTNNDSDLAKAVAKNSETAKVCSYAALGASVATLLPLSVLAIKTGKISKAVENIEKGAKPILENLSSATSAVNETATAAKSKVLELLNTVKSDELKDLFTELRTKVKGIETDEIVDEIIDCIGSLKETASGKIGEVDMSKVDDIFDTLNAKLRELNVPDLSAEAKSIISKLSGNANTVEMPRVVDIDGWRVMP